MAELNVMTQSSHPKLPLWRYQPRTPAMPCIAATPNNADAVGFLSLRMPIGMLMRVVPPNDPATAAIRLRGSYGVTGRRSADGNRDGPPPLQRIDTLSSSSSNSAT